MKNTNIYTYIDQTIAMKQRNEIRKENVKQKIKELKLKLKNHLLLGLSLKAMESFLLDFSFASSDAIICALWYIVASR